MTPKGRWAWPSCDQSPW